MRKNIAWLAVAVVVVAIIIGAILISREKPEALDAKKQKVAAVETKPEAVKPFEAAEPSHESVPESASTPAEPAEVEPAQELSTASISNLPPEFAEKQTPVWTITVPVAPGNNHVYGFILDGNKVPDPLNKSPKGPWGQQVFSIPPNVDHSSPRLLPGNRGQFFYEGSVKMRLWLEPEWRGGTWAIDEFQPANDAARKNLQDILADKSLSSVRGVVVDEQRKPVSRARVCAKIAFSHHATVECDNYGQFKIDRLPTADMSFGAHAWGFQDAEAKKVTVLPNGQASPIELVMKPGVVITGTVRDEMGKPVVRASIAAGSKIPPFFGYPTVHTDASGRYVHANLPPETYNLTAKHDNYAPVSRLGIVAKAGQKPIQADFVLGSGGVVTGKVTQDVAGESKPVAKVRIAISGRMLDESGKGDNFASFSLSGESREDGSFEVAHVPYNSNLSHVTAAKGTIKQNQSIDITYQKGSQPEPISHPTPRRGAPGRPRSECGKKAGCRCGHLSSGINPCR